MIQSAGVEEVPLLGATPAAGASREGSSALLYFVTLAAAVGGFLFGYDTGVVSGAMLLLEKDFSLSRHQQELIVSVTLVGCMLSTFVSNVVSERLGRRFLIFVSSLIFAAGAIVLALADGYAMLLAGRFIVGVGVGLASMGVPLYISEIAPPNLRGPSFAYSLPVHSFHTRRDRVASFGQHAVCMARPYREPHHSGQAEP